MRRLQRSAVVLLATAAAKVGCVAACSTPSREDEEARLAYLDAQLRSTSPGASVLEGEWFLVSLSMTALAARNLAAGYPDTVEERRALVERLTERALAADVRAFDRRLWGTDALATLDTREGHVGYLGHLALLLGTECALGSTKHAAQRRAVGAALERRYDEAPDGLVATYPNQVWIPDNAAALAGVALIARCEGREPPGVLERWPVDPKTKLFRFTPRAGARGSGAGWNSLYLPLIDERVAEQQFAQAQRVFGWSAPGLAAWREFPPGVEGHGDADSGPLVLGLSPAGTGFAIAGAARSDSALAGAMLRTAEGAGFTVPFGGRHYLLAPLVGEASVLAAKTARFTPSAATDALALSKVDHASAANPGQR